MQFNDIILSASLNDPKMNWIEWCEPNAMVRRHLVRGYNEQIYFAETSGNGEKIYKLEIHSSRINELTKKQIY